MLFSTPVGAVVRGGGCRFEGIFTAKKYHTIRHTYTIQPTYQYTPLKTTYCAQIRAPNVVILTDTKISAQIEQNPAADDIRQILYHRFDYHLFKSRVYSIACAMIYTTVQLDCTAPLRQSHARMRLSLYK